MTRTPALTTLLSERPNPQVKYSRFECLPPEIRNMIYSLCIVTSQTIIRSPLKKIKRKYKPFSTFWNILLVNKNIRQEASSWYYSSCVFVFGNASWGSTMNPNLQAMKSFTSRVNKEQLGLIKNVVIEIYGRSRFPMQWQFNPQRQFILGDKDDVANLHSMIRSLLTHFSGLETVTFVKKAHGPYWPNYCDDTRLQGEEVVNALVNLLLGLLKHKTISQIEVFSDELIPMHKAKETVLATKPEKAHIMCISKATMQPSSV